MTQTQIVQALAEKCDVSKKVSQGFLTALSETAIREVKKNGVFVLPEERRRPKDRRVTAPPSDSHV
jgi:DNA-binding protein HU-beta